MFAITILSFQNTLLLIWAIIAIFAYVGGKFTLDNPGKAMKCYRVFRTFWQK
jgi:hypothetical protein